MSVSIRPLGNTEGTDSKDIKRILQETFTDLEDQLNTRADIYGTTDGRIPAGLKPNDILFTFREGRIQLFIKSRTGFVELTADMLDGLSKFGTLYLGKIVGAAAPVVSQFPNPDDWGFYEHTGTAFYLCYNHAGTLKKVALA